MLSALRRRVKARLLALFCCSAIAGAAAPRQVCAQETSAGSSDVVVIRDAETETLLRTYADPLFRAGGLDVGFVRIVGSEAAIDRSDACGNRRRAEQPATITALGRTRPQNDRGDR